jgi:predicted glycosyltransferase
MEDRYYSKKLDQYFPTRLDFLLYAHDGRGFGHASRTIAVGMALKRLYPDKKTLFISGIPDANMLIGPAPLDWMKLPSYQTVIKDGIPEGQTGKAGFYKSVLGGLRAEMLRAAVDILRPRCVLVDHNPAGKRNELVEALEHTRKPDTHDTAWVLGLRGIIGEDRKLWSSATADLVQRYYREVLWYGDEALLGPETRQRISTHFNCRPISVGYVSRLQELRSYFAGSVSADRRPACTISLPWLGEFGDNLLQSLYSAALRIGPEHGAWHLYVPGASLEAIQARFAGLAFCRVEPIGENYLSSLLHARAALIYGGYNSILDIAAAQIPALIILRSTKDREQHEHLGRLQQRFGEQWHIIEEQDISEPTVARALLKVIEHDAPAAGTIDIAGAERAARILHGCIDEE